MLSQSDLHLDSVMLAAVQLRFLHNQAVSERDSATVQLKLCSLNDGRLPRFLREATCQCHAALHHSQAARHAHLNESVGYS